MIGIYRVYPFGVNIGFLHRVPGVWVNPKMCNMLMRWQHNIYLLFITYTVFKEGGESPIFVLYCHDKICKKPGSQ